MKITVRLDKRYRLADGRYPVKLAIARNGKTFYVPLGIEVEESCWDANAKNQDYIKNVDNRKSLNMHIRSRLSQAERTVMELQTKGLLRQFSNKQLIAYLASDRTGTIKNELLSFQAEQCIKQKTNKDSADTYRSALKAFQKYYDYDSFRLSDFTKNLIIDFHDKMIKDGLKPTTVNNYITRLRIIYNYAYDRRYIDTPFPRVSFKHEQTRKRSLLVEQIRKMLTMKCTSKQREYRDIFILMLYMRGINMKDLSELMLKDIRNGRIQYDRDKTGKPIEIFIEPEMMQIIERYKGEKHLLRMFDGHKPQEEYHKRYGANLMRSLRTAIKKAGIEEDVSAYWSRHTWSSLAIEIGVDIAYVSAGLSHSFGAPVTQLYIQYRQKKIDEESRRVIDYILDRGEFKR